MYFKVVCRITPKDQHPVEVVRLIEAQKMAGAVRFVAQEFMEITPLTVSEAVTLGKQGYEIEKVPE